MLRPSTIILNIWKKKPLWNSEETFTFTYKLCHFMFFSHPNIFWISTLKGMYQTYHFLYIIHPPPSPSVWKTSNGPDLFVTTITIAPPLHHQIYLSASPLECLILLFFCFLSHYCIYLLLSSSYLCYCITLYCRDFAFCWNLSA